MTRNDNRTNIQIVQDRLTMMPEDERAYVATKVLEAADRLVREPSLDPHLSSDSSVISSEDRVTWTGRVISASFEDGDSVLDCGLEDCECPTHDESPLPAGTYVTVRLDKDEAIGAYEVEIRVQAGESR